MEICSSCFLFSIITYTGLSGKDVYITNTLSSCQQLPGSGLFRCCSAGISRELITGAAGTGTGVLPSTVHVWSLSWCLP